MGETVEQFFDSLSGEYASAIERCVPRYGEMIRAVLDGLPAELHPRSVLDLGAGNGNLTSGILARYPGAGIRLVDLSGKALETARARFEGIPGLTFTRADFGELDFSDGCFDLVTSSISIHHLADPAKRSLFGRIHRWLSPGGVFAYSDQFSSVADGGDRENLLRWRAESERLGATAEEWKEWMAHQEAHDHHASLPDQMLWLEEAGFAWVDCPWRYLLWTVLVAGKEA